MIYKNDERYNLTSDDVRKVEKYVNGRFPVTFVTSRTRVTQATQKGKTTKRPPGVLVPFEAVLFNDKEGSVKWNYSKVPPIINRDGVKYYTNTEAGYQFSASWTIGKDRIDLLYYLLFCSNIVKGSPGCKKGSEEIQIDDRLKTAEQKNQIRERRVAVEGAIYGARAMSIEDLKRIARAFQVSGIELMEVEEVKDALMTAIEGREASSGDGYAYFDELTDNKEKQQIYAAIQVLKDAKLVSYNAGTAEWWVVEPTTKKKMAKVGRLLKNMTNDQSLLECVFENEDSKKLVRDLANQILAEKSESKNTETAPAE